jgi:hypothetical protein
MATAIALEDIEGLELEPAGEDISSYPLDDIMVRKDTRNVGDVVKRIAAGRYVMNPDFQRDFVWPPDKQSKLIESCVMRIPLPVLYVAEGEDGRITVVDGLQRLSTFNAFLSNKLRLSGLGKSHPLEGKRFADLPIHLQERIEDTQLTLYILDKDAPEAARLDIFDRVNSGIPLSRQQMRNALYNGPATQWLATMADHPSFLSATGETLSKATMRDREAINRFAAFHVLGWDSYYGDMDLFLARALGTINKWSSEQIQQLTFNFVTAMEYNEFLFGRHAFRKSLVEQSESAPRSVINISMFDIFSFYLARTPEDQITHSHSTLKHAVVNIMHSDRFINAITYSTNSTVQVRARFEILGNVLHPWTV